jgi:hypothetical protein
VEEREEWGRVGKSGKSRVDLGLLGLSGQMPGRSPIPGPVLKAGAGYVFDMVSGRGYARDLQPEKGQPHGIIDQKWVDVPISDGLPPCTTYYSLQKGGEYYDVVVHVWSRNYTSRVCSCNFEFCFAF